MTRLVTPITSAVKASMNSVGIQGAPSRAVMCIRPVITVLLAQGEAALLSLMVNRADEAATQAASVQRIEIVSDRRRAHDSAFRAGVVADSHVPGTRVRELAARHGICTSLVYRWRRERTGAAATGSALRLVPIRLVEERHAAETRQELSRPARPPAPEAAAKPASMEIEFPGGVRVRVDETVSQAALRRMVAVLRG